MKIKKTISRIAFYGSACATGIIVDQYASFQNILVAFAINLIALMWIQSGTKNN